MSQVSTSAAGVGGTAQTATLGSLLEAIWRHIVIVVVITALAVAAAYGLSLQQNEVYRSDTRIFLRDPADSVTGDTGRSRIDPALYTTQQVTRVTALPVLDRVSEQLNGRWSSGQLKEMLSAGPEGEALIVSISVAAPTAEEAEEIARAVTAAYGQFNEETSSKRAEAAVGELKRSRKQLRTQVEEAKAALAKSPDDPLAQARAQTLTEELLAAENTARNLAIEATATGSGVDFVEEPQTSEDPVQPKPVRNAALAGALGFVLAAALADILTRRRRQLDMRVDKTMVLGAPLLATIPNFHRTGDQDGEPLFDIEAAESYQFLLASFESAIAQTGAHSVLVTSASAGEGKSLTALHLARGLAIQGRDVMLIDADIRARGLTSLLNADDEPGLVSLTRGQDIATVTRRYRISNDVQLRVIPAGHTPNHPTGLVATDRFREVISGIAAANELTVIDGGPLLTVADASALAMQVSGILLVLDAAIAEEDLFEVQRRLRLISTPLIGYVLNRSTHVRPAPYPDDSRRARGIFSRRTTRTPAQPPRPTTDRANGHQPQQTTPVDG